MKNTRLTLLFAGMSVLSLVAIAPKLMGSSVVKAQPQQFNREATAALYELCKTGGTAAQVAELIQKGANVNAHYGESKGTCLQRAASYCNNEICEALIAHNAKVGDIDDFVCTALHHAAEAQQKCTDEQRAQTCALLLKHGIDIDAQNEFFRTALHCAAMNGTLQTAILLMRRGASLSLCNDSGRTPLMLASLNGKHSIAKALLREELRWRITPQKTTVKLMRSYLKEAYFLMKCFEDSGLPWETRLMIFEKAFARELTCLLLDSHCCSLLPIKTARYVDLLKEQIPALFLEKTTILGKTTHQAIIEKLKSTHGACRGERIDFLNPETLSAHVEEIFIAPEKVPAQKN